MTAQNFDRLQQRILFVLEEAGEDDIVALTNAIEKRIGDVNEVMDTSKALASLLRSDLIELAKSRDENSLRWIPLAKADSFAILTNLVSSVRWSNEIWQWQTYLPRIEVLLTEAGLVEARRLLSNQS